MSILDLTQKLERLEAFEERLGVTFKSLSAFIDLGDEDFITIDIRGEVHTLSGTEISQDFVMVIAAYDSSDRVVGTSGTSFYADDFFGFDTFSETLRVPMKEISKVRIYPKKR